MPAKSSTGTKKRIEIVKSKRVLRLYIDGTLQNEYRIIVGFSPEGTKTVEGDGRTPEGEFYVCARNPESRYHRSLCISYPSPDDALRGLTRGLISPEEHDQILEAWDVGEMPPQKTALGGEIYIHGHGADRESTRGGIALADIDMEELFGLAEIGTPVSILP